MTVLGILMNLAVLGFLLAAIPIVETRTDQLSWLFFFATTGINLIRWVEKYLETLLVSIAIANNQVKVVNWPAARQGGGGNRPEN